MRFDERSGLALLMAIAALGILALAHTSPWFYYEDSTGRQTAPEGPHGAETGEVTHELTFGVETGEGNIEPSDPAKAEQAQQWIRWGIYGAAVALGIMILGEIPYVSLVLVRPIGVTMAGLALGGIGFSLYAGWFMLPASMAGYGVEDPFTARLLDDGYIRTRLMVGYLIMALSIPVVFAAGVWKFGAGDADPAFIERWSAKEAKTD